MVKGSDVEDVVEELLRGTPGAPEGNQHAAKPWVQTNRNNDTDCLGATEAPAIIPMPAPEPAARKRDYSRESKQGNSVGYTLRRLEKHAPEYLERVKAGGNLDRIATTARASGRPVDLV